MSSTKRSLAAPAELVSSAHESLQRKCQFETGLLLAQQGSQTDTLLRLVRTPAADGGAAKQTELDAQWMLAHAAQVARMLPGGVVVLGVYAYAPQPKLNALEAQLNSPVLSEILRRLQSSHPSSKAVGAAGADAEETPPDWHSILILMPSDAKRVSFKALARGASKPSPIDPKMTTAPLHCFSASWVVDARLELGEGVDPSQQLAVLQQQLAPPLEALRNAVLTIDGVLANTVATVGQLAKAGSLASPHEVAVYTPAVEARAKVAVDGGGGVRRLHLRGEVYSRTFAAAKDTTDHALAALRADLARSLEVRLELLLDELAEEEEEEDETAPLGLTADGAAAWPLPRRVSLTAPIVHICPTPFPHSSHCAFPSF